MNALTNLTLHCAHPKIVIKTTWGSKTRRWNIYKVVDIEEYKWSMGEYMCPIPVHVNNETEFV